jgi:hypothetical protein
VPVVQHIPALPQVAAQATVLAQRFDVIQKLSEVDANALIEKLRDTAKRGSWDSITFREWKKAAWVMLASDLALVDEPGFLDRLLEEYRLKSKRSAYQGLILTYIRDFDPANPAIRRIAKEILRIIDMFAWPWASRQKSYELFSEYGPQTIATACLTFGEPTDILNDAGIGGARSSGGLAAHAYRHAVEQLQQMLAQKHPDFSILDRIMRWSIGTKGLTHPRHRAALAQAMLLPWANNAPPDEQKEKISTFLLAHFHDPRLPINAKDWVGVQEDAKAVLRKWLTGVALEQFFVVVDQVAQERMWRYRRSFWSAYYNANAINDAWVLFGSDARSFAKRAFGKTQTYGILEKGYQVQADHSVLLMKIGKLTVADWSHNGKCHIWLDGNEDAPKLYRERYTRPTLIQGSDNDGQVHYGSEHGTWQRQVESYIRKRSGFSLSERHYMPDDRRY